MKKMIMKLLALSVLSTVLYAGGGKAVAPAEAVVAPIPEVVSPIPWYVGLGVMASFINRDPCPCGGGDLSDRRYGGIIRAGYDFNNYFGIEARALKTLESKAFSKVTHYGLYAKPQYHIVDQANIYALLGYGRTIVDYTNGIISSHNPKNGFSYGVGLEYDFGKDKSEGTYDRAFDGQGDQEEGWGMWIDAQHLLFNAGSMHTDSNIITAGITYDF
jgi:OOP family OmpA-OmpF porin